VDALLEERFASLIPEDPALQVYGEVNSYLRYNVAWLRRRFDPVLIHLVRDGRDFVRSAWVREVGLPSQPQLPIVPADGEPHADRWGRMSRFERICWIWAHTNGMLADAVERRVRLEDVLSSYAAFREGVLEPAALDVGEARWREAVARPRNTSEQYRARRWLREKIGRKTLPPAQPLPPWREWSREYRDAFWEICGPVMERLGYT